VTALLLVVPRPVCRWAQPEVVDIAEAAIDASGEDYNVYVPIINTLGVSKKDGARHNMSLRMVAALENQLKHVPEDARARVLLGAYYAELGREEDSLRELNLAVTLRANEASILYNAACVYCLLNRKSEALETLRKAWEAGSKDSVWARRDPDLAMLHGDPEFERVSREARTGFSLIQLKLFGQLRSARISSGFAISRTAKRCV
jgi:non-specific serine/threonine protein kinase